MHSAVQGGVLFCSDDLSSYPPEVRAFYEKLLQNFTAEDIHVKTENGFRVSYTVNGERCVLNIPEYE